MKSKYLLIAFIIVSVCVSANAQPAHIPIYRQVYKPLKDFKGDASQYLIYNFREGKVDYIGQNLNLLLNKLELETVKYIPSMDYPTSHVRIIKFFIKDTSTNLNEPKTQIKEFAIIIIFKNVIPFDTSFRMANKNKLQWTSDEKTFYGNRIIENIIILGVPPDGEEPPDLEADKKIIFY